MPDYSILKNRVERRGAALTLREINQSGKARYANTPEEIAKKIRKHFGVRTVYDDKFIWLGDRNGLSKL